MDNTGLFDIEGNELNIAEVMAILPSITFLKSVNRIEVIDENGRSYVNWKSTNETAISFQDDCRTLKIFIREKLFDKLREAENFIE